MQSRLGFRRSVAGFYPRLLWVKAKCTLGNECFRLVQNILMLPVWTACLPSGCNCHSQTPSLPLTKVTVVTVCQLHMSVPVIDPSSAFYHNSVLVNFSCISSRAAACLLSSNSKKTPNESIKAHQSTSEDGSLIAVTSLDQCCFLSGRLLPA